MATYAELASARLTSLGTNVAAATSGLLGAPTSNRQVLTAASGNFTVPAGVSMIEGIIQAAGGGGGGCAAAAATGSGGTAGETIQFRMTVTPGQAIAYTQGATGGAGGAAGNNNGANGADSTFGTLTATGGRGGNGSASGNAAAILGATVNPLKHAAAPTTDLQFINTGIVVSAAGATGVGGSGGQPNNAWGVSGTGASNAAGGNATGNGAGGAGGGSTGASAWAGGNGSPGCIVVWW